MSYIKTALTDFTYLQSRPNKWPKVDNYIMGLDVADLKLKKMDHLGVVTLVCGEENYTNSTPMPNTVGGYEVGTTFDNVGETEMWDGLLYPYQYPAFTTFSIAGIGTTLEVGAEISAGVKTASWTTSNQSNINANTIEIAGPGFTTLSGLSNDGSEDITFSSIVSRSSDGTETWTIYATNSKSQQFSRTTTNTWWFKHFFGASNVILTGSSTPTEVADVLNVLQQPVLRAGKSASVTAGSYNDVTGNYTYIAYAAKYGDLANVIQNGALPVLGAFTKVGAFDYTNDQGHLESYNVYKSNADKAFASGTTLAIS